MFNRRYGRREFLRGSLALGTTAAGMAALAACGAPGGTSGSGSSGGGGNRLEIFSWWTSPGEVEALDALYKVYKASNAKVEIINAAISGGAGAGGNAKAALKTRLLGNDPPDSFQVHLGRELIDTHVVANRMEPLDDIFKSEGWDKVFPKQLIDIASKDGKLWSVPVNIHRSNVLWFNKKVLADNGVNPPNTFDEFFAAADKLKAKGVAALAVGEAAPGHVSHIFETVLMGVLSPDEYRGLWTGKFAWADQKVTASLNNLKRMLDYANTDYPSVASGDTLDLVIKGTAAMVINGDWNNGGFKSKKFADYGYVPTPGSKGRYGVLSDSFGLPKGIKDKDATLAWLKVCGSKAGQDAFNPLKGSIPARNDADKSVYDTYQQAAIADFQKDELLPSVNHGAAAKESWMTDMVNTMNTFSGKKDVAATQAELVKIAKDAGVG
ncbi:MAG TPA: ABC transporter substrate-binding protein [Thermomicrobiales bacterium]